MKQTGKTTVFIRYALSYTVVVLTLFFVTIKLMQHIHTRDEK